MLTLNIDRDKASRLGLNMADVQDALSIAVGGREAGLVFQGDRRFDILVRLPDTARGNLEAIKRIPIRLPAADGMQRTAYVQLGDVASLDIAPGPNQSSREDGKRRVVVTANVRGRDVGSFVAEAQTRLAAQVKVPTGDWTTWGGTFEQLQSAAQRLKIVVPVALLLVFMLLFAMFGNRQGRCAGVHRRAVCADLAGAAHPVPTDALARRTGSASSAGGGAGASAVVCCNINNTLRQSPCVHRTRAGSSPAMTTLTAACLARSRR